MDALSETHERALRNAAVNAITPPVFGLDILELGQGGSRVVAVVIPATVDVPHLIYKGEYFGAPIRNNADTVWMRERQVDALYRARFTEQRNAREALTALHTRTRPPEETPRTEPGSSVWPGRAFPQRSPRACGKRKPGSCSPKV